MLKELFKKALKLYLKFYQLLKKFLWGKPGKFRTWSCKVKLIPEWGFKRQETPS